MSTDWPVIIMCIIMMPAAIGAAVLGRRLGRCQPGNDDDA